MLGHKRDQGKFSLPLVPSTGLSDSGAATSRAAVYLSGSSCDGQSAECLIFPFAYTVLTHRMLAQQPLLTVICVSCLQEWSRHVNACPADRQMFNFTLVRHHLEGQLIRRVPVKSLRQGLMFCEVWGECDLEDCLLLCDECNFGCHLECLEPRLNISPSEIMLCLYCVLYKLFYPSEENRNFR